LRLPGYTAEASLTAVWGQDWIGAVRASHGWVRCQMSSPDGQRGPDIAALMLPVPVFPPWLCNWIWLNCVAGCGPLAPPGCIQNCNLLWLVCILT